MKTKLTERFLKAINLQEKPYEVVDTEINGFRLRVEPTGILTYYLVYRTTNGIKKRYRLGRHGAITVTQARDLAKQFSAKAVSGEDIQAKKKRARSEKDKTKSRTLGKFIEQHYAPWVTVERKTGLETLKRLNANFSELMNLSLEELSPLLVEKWNAEQRKRGKAPATINRDVVALKAVLSKAVDWGWLETSPLIKLKPLRTDDRAKVRYLNEDEEKRLLDALEARDRLIISRRTSGNRWRAKRGHPLLPRLDGEVYPDYLTPMVLLAMHTGLRRGELFSLSWEHVDLNKATVTVAGDKAKSGKTRHIPLNSTALYALKARKKQRPEHGLVFPSKDGNQMNNVRKAWANLLKDSDINNFRWHDLRHHFASRLVMAGVDLNTVRELLGHSELTTTLRYAHLAPEHKAEAVARLVNFSGPMRHDQPTMELMQI